MKLSKIAWYILGAGILIIALGTLYMLYSQKAGEQEQLNDALLSTQASLPMLASERTNLENTLAELKDKLAQVKPQLEKAKVVFPDSVESIEVDELLFAIADEWDLDITSLTASEARDETVEVEMEDIEVEDIEVEDVTYRITYFAVKVRGKEAESAASTREEYQVYIDKTVGDILSFISSVVAQKDFITATIELVSLDIPEPPLEEELEEEEAEQKPESAEAIINMVIYTYEGE